MKIVSVIPLKKSTLKSDLTYFTSSNIEPGDVVSVMLKSKKVLAMVTSTEELKNEKSNIKSANFGLKKIIENKGSSIFRKEYLESIFDTSKYFVQNRNSCLLALIPNVLIENYEKILKIKKQNNENKKEYENANNLKTEKLLFQYRTEDRVSIYRTYIRESFARNKSVIMILPTQFDIEKFSKLLSRGTEQFTFTMHSGISAKKNLATCEKILASLHPVFILCTPPYLAIPKNDIGTIIMEHENSSAYKTIARPHVDLRTFVEIYASKINAKFILAGDMLRFETIKRQETDNINPLHPLSFRTDFGGEIDIIARKNESEKKFKIMEDDSINAIKRRLENKENVFIFSLRKGLGTMTACRDCGTTVGCKKCGAPLVLYSSHKGEKRMFACNRCEMGADGDLACSSCGGWNLISLGIGTDTVYEELKKLFPKTNVFKLDKESTKTAASAKKIINEFENNSGSILVGTEMVFYYIKKKVSLSIIASFDSLWSIPNYKMGEKITQILFSMIENTSDQIIIQTKNEKDDAILAIKSGNLLPFVRDELENRKTLNYPPFTRFMKITCLGDKEETAKRRKALSEVFKNYSPEIFSGFIAKYKGKYVTNALIRIEPNEWSLPELKENSTMKEDLYNKLSALPPGYEIFVDPEDLL
ncbi:MAG: hypothetical protein WC609_01455 [Candidatus Paceibacterota bacterium]|jgi:primosomal protein N' (replication factor Y)